MLFGAGAPKSALRASSGVVAAAWAVLGAANRGTYARLVGSSQPVEDRPAEHGHEPLERRLGERRPQDLQGLGFAALALAGFLQVERRAVSQCLGQPEPQVLLEDCVDLVQFFAEIERRRSMDSSRSLTAAARASTSVGKRSHCCDQLWARAQM